MGIQARQCVARRYQSGLLPHSIKARLHCRGQSGRINVGLKRSRNCFRFLGYGTTAIPKAISKGHHQMIEARALGWLAIVGMEENCGAWSKQCHLRTFWQAIKAEGRAVIPTQVTINTQKGKSLLWIVDWSILEIHKCSARVVLQRRSDSMFWLVCWEVLAVSNKDMFEARSSLASEI